MNDIATIDKRPNAIANIGQGKTVLGEAQIRIPVSGRIRSGIKVLTAAGVKLKGAQEIYDKGVAEGKTWDAIELEIKAANKDFNKSPLTPRNVPYFRVLASDFKMPQAAQALMDEYATDGEACRQLYRFPVIFPMDNWQAIMPHQLRSYTRAGLNFWSEYGPDGERYCKTYEEVAPNTKVYGGRKVMLRRDNAIQDGLCSPEKCPQYQKGECKLGGRFLFYVPGVPGSGAIELPTTSFYSLNNARATLEMVAFLRGGKISGTHDGKPIFWISKAQREISRIDPADGKPKRVKQWLIELEADIDMLSVFQSAEPAARLAAGERAAAVLGYDGKPGDESEEPDDEGGDVIQGAVESDDQAQAANAQQADPQPKEPTKAKLTAAEHALIEGLRADVAKGLEIIGIAPQQFKSYAEKKWGPGALLNPKTLEAALTEVNRGADDADNYRDQVLLNG